MHSADSRDIIAQNMLLLKSLLTFFFVIFLHLEAFNRVDKSGEAAFPGLAFGRILRSELIHDDESQPRKRGFAGLVDSVKGLKVKKNDKEESK